MVSPEEVRATRFIRERFSCILPPNGMKIFKKVRHEYFEAILEGRKQFEIRLADFRYKPGDTLVLLEQRQGKRELSGRKLECEILFTINTKTAEK
jgi:hypothetical protein